MEAREAIAFVQKEEALFKTTVEEYKDIEEITTIVEPYHRLFSVVSRWQRAERRYVVNMGWYLMAMGTCTTVIITYQYWYQPVAHSLNPEDLLGWY